VEVEVVDACAVLCQEMQLLRLILLQRLLVVVVVGVGVLAVVVVDEVEPKVVEGMGWSAANRLLLQHTRRRPSLQLLQEDKNHQNSPLLPMTI
jgi:hypothetical protein